MKVILCIIPPSSSSVTGVLGSASSSRTGGVGNACRDSGVSVLAVGGVVVVDTVGVVGAVVGAIVVGAIVGELSLSVVSPRAFARVLDFERAVSGMGGMMEGRRASSLIGYGWV